MTPQLRPLTGDHPILDEGAHDVPPFAALHESRCRVSIADGRSAQQEAGAKEGQQEDTRKDAEPRSAIK